MVSAETKPFSRNSVSIACSVSPKKITMFIDAQIAHAEFFLAEVNREPLGQARDVAAHEADAEHLAAVRGGREELHHYATPSTGCAGAYSSINVLVSDSPSSPGHALPICLTTCPLLPAN